MSTRRLRRTLWALSGIFLLGSVLSLTISLRLPCDLPEMALSETRPRVERPLPAPREVWTPPIEELASLDLRRRLFDPPPSPPEPEREEPRRPPPAIRLVGTVLSHDRPTALVAFKDSVSFKRPGDLVGDESNPAKLLSVESDRITVEHEGEVLLVTREGIER